MIYLSKAQQAINEAGYDVKRTRQWVTMERRTFWEGEAKRRARQLDQAEQELYSARLAGDPGILATRKIVVKRAERLVEEARQKLRRIKKWGLEWDDLIGPHARKLETLRSLLDGDMGNAVSFLNNAVDSLTSYTAMKAPAAPDAPTTGAEPGADS